MVKALADRLAEAFAERLHQRVRKEFWGYAPDETLSQRRPDRARNIAASARRRAIRRSPTTPRRATLFKLLDSRAPIGVKLTESFAMWPGAVGLRPLFQPSRQPLFRRRQDRARPGRGLRAAQGLDARRGRALAGADPQLRSAGRGAHRGRVIIARLASPHSPVSCPRLGTHNHSRSKPAHVVLFAGT